MSFDVLHIYFWSFGVFLMSFNAKIGSETMEMKNIRFSGPRKTP